MESPLAITLPYEEEVICKSQWRTIGHDILEEDHRVDYVPNMIFQRLDFIITQVLNKVSIGKVNTVNQAKAILEQIEIVITSTDFVCSVPYFLIHSFSQGLYPRELVENVIQSPENKERLWHIIPNKNRQFSHVDCDLSSLLYLSIGEVLQIPLFMVEVPRHNFIRWRLNNDSYLNWDTNWGYSKYTDDLYANHYGVKQEHINNCTYLVDLSIEEVKGYFCFIRGITFHRKRSFQNAINEYQTSISKYKRSPLARNNIAWLFVSVREVQKMISRGDALQYAIEACEIYRVANNIGTLACVYAEQGDFQNAIKMATEAYDLSGNAIYPEWISGFHEGKTLLEMEGG